jgi:hypothetical protein
MPPTVANTVTIAVTNTHLLVEHGLGLASIASLLAVVATLACNQGAKQRQRRQAAAAAKQQQQSSSSKAAAA